MELPQNSYCYFVANLPLDNRHRIYHDTEYGFALRDDNELFGRLLLEINQAGLSWDIILKKKENFRRAYANFELEKVATFTEEDRTRLLTDKGIVRNKLKVNAAIFNAQQLLKIQEEAGSFHEWLHGYYPKEKNEWVKLFKKHFKFVGGEIVGEFLMSIGLLAGAHHENCPIYEKIKKSFPPLYNRTKD